MAYGSSLISAVYIIDFRIEAPDCRKATVIFGSATEKIIDFGSF
jgi:hypothetical protein